MRSTVSGPRYPRRSARSCASDEPPGRPRRPLDRADWMAAHVSPGASRTGPESAVRVLARGLPMGVGPRQDLLDVQARQVLLVADAPLLLEQIGQRGPARQAAAALTQGAVDLAPVQLRVVAHRAGVAGHGRGADGRRPRPGSVTTRQVLLVADASCSCSRSQRGPARQAAGALTQARLTCPQFSSGWSRHRAGALSRPPAGGGVVGVGPGQDQVDREAGRRPRCARARRRGRRVGNCSASQARSRSAGDSGFAPSATPRSSASSRASDDPPGSPRRPRLKAVSIADQVSSSAPPTGPERRSGHRPVAVRWASAQRRIRSTSSADRFPTAELGALALPPLAAREAPDPLLMIPPPGPPSRPTPWLYYAISRPHRSPRRIGERNGPELR